MAGYYCSKGEASMDINALARELENLKFEDGHSFESGVPFYEVLGLQRAEGLLRALEARGYRVVCEDHPHIDSPPISEMEGEERRKVSH
jgi:hypothetical protein